MYVVYIVQCRDRLQLSGLLDVHVCMRISLRLFGGYNMNARATYVIVTLSRRPLPQLKPPHHLPAICLAPSIGL